MSLTLHPPTLPIGNLQQNPFYTTAQQLNNKAGQQPFGETFLQFSERAAAKFHTTPWSLLITLLVTTLLGLFFLYLLRKAYKENRESTTSQATDMGWTQAEHEPLPPIGGIVSQYFVQRGYVSVGDISAIFLRALAFIKKTIRIPHALYHLPWFIVIGTERSGKSSLFEAGGLNMPLGIQEFTKGQKNAKLKWWFLDQSIFLELRGDTFLGKNAVQPIVSGLSTLVQLLKRYRTARPINGMVLTIPATDLYGTTPADNDTIQQRALALASLVANAQRSISLRLPVYVIITKTDHIPGFQSFCERLPASKKQNMLGWSNPYALEAHYSESWIDEAFNSISNTLHQLRLAIFATHGEKEHNDGVFLFPKELATIKNTLSLYMNTLFNNTSYNEGMLFRGFYFTGQSISPNNSIVLSTQTSTLQSSFPPFHALAEADDQAISLAASSTHQGNSGIPTEIPYHAIEDEGTQGVMGPIYFVQDLFTSKITVEGGLASPLKNHLLASHYTLQWARAGVLGFMLVSGYGLYNAYAAFSSSRNTITPVLKNMNFVLRDLQASRTNTANGKSLTRYQTPEAFALHTRQVIDMMIQLQKTNLVSFFVPASWFSNISNDLNKSLSIAFQEVIMRSIANGLVIKAQNLLYLRPSSQHVSTQIGQLLLPTTSPEFKLVAYFVKSLAELDTYLAMYHALRQTGEPAHLRALVAYTFNGNLPDDFWQHYAAFRALLSSSQIKSIQLSDFREKARSTLGQLYQNFLAIVFSKVVPNSLPAQLIQMHGALAENQPLLQPDAQTLKKIGYYLTHALLDLGPLGKTWLDQPYFNPGPEWNDFCETVDKSKLFGKPVTQFLVDQTAKGFASLKKDLRTLGSHLSLSGSPTHQPSDSQFVFMLESTLSRLFSHDFMNTPLEPASLSTIPFGKTLKWDEQYLTYAYTMAQNYDTFTTKSLSQFPTQWQAKLKLLGKTTLQLNTKNVLAKAQHFVDIPALNGSDEIESFLLAQSKDLEAISSKMTKLLTILSETPEDPYTHTLTALLRTYNFWLLENVDRLLQISNPFGIKDFTFSWWNGDKGAAKLGFMTKDGLGLKNYVKQQMIQLSRLSLDIAKPIVAFLTTKQLQDGSNKALFNRWSTIIYQMTTYQKSTPGNTPQQLEAFITEDLDTLTQREAVQKITIEQIHTASSDFFLETLRALQNGMRSRAEILQRTRSLASIKELFNYFNVNLKGNYPFVNKNKIENAPDADPEKMKEFYRLYSLMGKNASEALDQIQQLGSMSRNLVQFFQQIDKIKAFFPQFLTPQSGVYTPTLAFDIDFRVNREKEVGGQMVADWIFNLSEAETLNKKNQKRTGEWCYGNEVTFQFRWPNSQNLLSSPETDPAQPHLSVNGLFATFSYKGPWSLLKAISLQEAPQGEAGKEKASNSTVLKFVIPSGKGQKTILYNMITLSAATVNPKISGTKMEMPLFPAAVPEIDPGIEAIAQEAVFSSGKLKEVTTVAP